MADTPSVPVPRNVTWPMVAYVLVRELKSILTVAGGAAIAVVIVLHAPEKVMEAALAAVLPALVAHLGRSQPADGLAGSAGTLGMLALVAHAVRGRLGI